MAEAKLLDLGEPQFEPWDKATDFTPHQLVFQRPKPIAHAFMLSEGPCDLLMGPEGSGKTTASMQTTILQTLRFPICRDGVIRAHGCVLRNSYRDLYKNTLPSWWSVFPRNFPGTHFEGGQDRPGRHTLRFFVGNTAVEMVVDFFGLGDVSIEQMMRGYQPSWVVFDEIDLFEFKAVTFAYGRTGRFPGGSLLPDHISAAMARGEFSLPRRTWGSLNPPDIDHWVPEYCLEKGGKITPEGDKFFNLFRQPSGLAPDAEFFPPVTRLKYEQDAKRRPAHEVRRFVHGEFGPSREGEIVFPEFNDPVHYALQPLAYDPGLPIFLGIDQGGRPAAVIMQMAENGQVRVLAEVKPERDGVTHISTFAEMLKSTLTNRFPGAQIGGAWGDPAGWYGVDKEKGELAWMQVLQLALGCTIWPSPSGEYGIRLEAVRGLLVRSIDATTPMFTLDPSCKMLRKGFNSHYVNKETKSGSTRHIEPFKNKYADVQDALQYGLVGMRGRELIIDDAANIGTARKRRDAPRVHVLKADFDVIG